MITILLDIYWYMSYYWCMETINDCTNNQVQYVVVEFEPIVLHEFCSRDSLLQWVDGIPSYYIDHKELITYRIREV